MIHCSCPAPIDSWKIEVDQFMKAMGNNSWVLMAVWVPLKAIYLETCKLPCVFVGPLWEQFAGLDGSRIWSSSALFTSLCSFHPRHRDPVHRQDFLMIIANLLCPPRVKALKDSEEQIFKRTSYPTRFWQNKQGSFIYPLIDEHGFKNGVGSYHY